METIVTIFNFIVANWDQILLAVMAFLSAVIGIALLIPGEQPEKTLQKVVDFLKSISKK